MSLNDYRANKLYPNISSIFNRNGSYNYSYYICEYQLTAYMISGCLYLTINLCFTCEQR
jgi:hypothetical protein